MKLKKWKDEIELTITTGFSTTTVFADELPERPAADDADAFPIDDEMVCNGVCYHFIFSKKDFNTLRTILTFLMAPKKSKLAARFGLSINSCVMYAWCSTCVGLKCDG